MTRYRLSRLGIAPHRIDIPRTPTEIVIEGLGDFEHTLDVFHGEGGFLVDGEGLSRADGVLDL